MIRIHLQGKIQVFRWDGISWNQIGNDINGSQQDTELEETQSQFHLVKMVIH